MNDRLRLNGIVRVFVDHPGNPLQPHLSEGRQVSQDLLPIARVDDRRLEDDHVCGLEDYVQGLEPLSDLDGDDHIGPIHFISSRGPVSK